MESDRLSCSTMLYTGHSRESALAEIARLGFRNVDIWASGYLGSEDAVGAPHLARHIDPEVDDIASVQTDLRRHDLKLHALSIFRCDVPAKIRRIELAAELGAECVIFCAEKVSLERFAEETVGPLLERCEKVGVHLAVENHIERAVDTTASMLRLADMFDSPWLSFALAPPHLAALNESPSEAVRQIPVERISSVYIWDLMPDYSPDNSINFGTGEQQMPGGGSIDFAGLAIALREAGYNGALNLGVHGTTGWSLDKIAAEVESSRPVLNAFIQRLSSKAPRTSTIG